MTETAARARELIGKSPLFVGVPVEVAARALADIELLEFAPGESVVVEGRNEDGDDHSALFILVDGQLTATRAMAGRRTQRLSTIVPGDFFGELARVEEGVRSATVSASTPAVVARLSGPAADRLIADAPAVMRTIAATIARRLRAADEARIAARLSEERLSLIGKAAAMLVHDLKDPLGRVMNAAECIEQGIGERSVWTAQSRRAAEFMLAMVKDLSAYAKGERTYAREPVKLAAVIDEVESFGLRPLETGGKITVLRQVRGDATLLGDQRALSRAILNIVKNAGEAMSTSGGTLTFDVQVDTAAVRFVVADTGGGIPASVLPTMFEPFATYGKKNGTGLGMAMTKAAVEAHDGQIEVATEAGRGTRFTVTIPLQPSHVVPAAQGR